MQNMILAVGPGTPASTCWAWDEDEDSSDNGFAFDQSDSSTESDDDDEEGADEGVARMPRPGSDDEDEEEASIMSTDDKRGSSGEQKLSEPDSESSDDSSDDIRRRAAHEGLQVRAPANRVIRLQQHNVNAQDGDTRNEALRPSIRHGGCINTACWMDCPWRLSLAGSDGHPLPASGSANIVPSREYTTQLVTSGDDRVVKFWDVRDAMGSANPLPGGWDTFSPFSTTELPSSKAVLPSFRKYYNHPDHVPKVAGGVNLLASISTGHRLNVFDVKPVNSQPGKILTCAADGFLRLCDLETNQSSVVVNPTTDEMDSMLFSTGKMAFSQHFVTANTGLLCSERGLHRFDLRVSPREQETQSLLHRLEICKTCAVWSPFGSPSNGDADSNFVFAGGSDTVGLYDLRMEVGSRLERLQEYRPTSFDDVCAASVSGLDVSKDGKELLVSYEGDQVYTFPTFYKTASSAGPTLEEIKQLPEDVWSAIDDDRKPCMPELASYGGHLNRLTFLKNAKYAGPNDEYICTGSDSGHAWIYERSSGAVVSFLGADSVTCNGVIPHPTLPAFITYGIDSTAKLWRATGPVDRDADDSPTGRAKCSLEQRFEMSPVARSWEGVQALLQRLGGKGIFMPDYVAGSEEVSDSRFSSAKSRRGIDGYDSPLIGNTMRSLPYILRQNRFQCYRSLHLERAGPVENVLDFDHHTSVIRSRFQADRLGSAWDASEHWMVHSASSDCSMNHHPADLVPDNPSDWIEYDGDMVELPVPGRSGFLPEHFQGDANADDLAFVMEHYQDVSITEPIRPRYLHRSLPWLVDRTSVTDASTPWPMFEDSAISTVTEFQKQSRINLYETALLLKEGGNEAMKEGSFELAARRYDKAIQYCAVAFMRYEEGRDRLSHLTEGHHDCAKKDSKKQIVMWSPLLKILITCRLNMALLLLKPAFVQSSRAAYQARHALRLLDPFTREQGKVIVERNETKVVVKTSEPVETFMEANVLLAKCQFRLGSAELALGLFKAAVKNFECSLKTSFISNPGYKPDSLVVRKLHEAKLQVKSKKKRDRKKFERIIGNEANSTTTDGRATRGKVTPSDSTSS